MLFIAQCPVWSGDTAKQTDTVDAASCMLLCMNAAAGPEAGVVVAMATWLSARHRQTQWSQHPGGGVVMATWLSARYRQTRSTSMLLTKTSLSQFWLVISIIFADIM